LIINQDYIKKKFQYFFIILLLVKKFCQNDALVEGG